MAYLESKPRYEVLDGLRGVAALCVVGFHMMECYSADISFPLYITHYPVLYMHMSWAQRHLDSPVSTHIFVAITTTILVIMNAWAALKLYDLPVRAWLKEHWLKK